MKLFVWVLLLTGLLLAQEKVYAQEAYRDVVCLKNGSIIKGIIVDVETPESVGIRISDGSLFVYKKDDIEMIRKEIVEMASYTQHQPQKNVYRKKEPALAFLLSFLLPGGGQYYNREYVKGGIMTALAVGSYAMMFAGVNDYSYNYREFDNRKDGMIVFGAILCITNALWSMFDAPIVASRINKLTNIQLSKNVHLQIKPNCSINNEFIAGKMTSAPNIGMKLSLTLK